METGEALLAAMVPHRPGAALALHHTDVADGTDPDTDPAPIAALIGLKGPIHQLAAFQEGELGHPLHAGDPEPDPLPQGLRQV
jgi:hypothetical protein